MKFAMMAIDRNRQLESCRRFLVMQLESVQKLLEMGISEEAYQEVMGMFLYLLQSCNKPVCLRPD